MKQEKLEVFHWTRLTESQCESDKLPSPDNGNYDLFHWHLINRRRSEYIAEAPLMRLLQKCSLVK
jgi:hypothetical protein